VTFLIDAQLPSKTCEILIKAGFTAKHVEILPIGDESTDQDIIKYADKYEMMIMTKDMDFYHSHMILDRPKKLFLITTGNISNRQLFNLIRSHTSTIKQLISTCNYIEMSNEGIFGG